MSKAREHYYFYRGSGSSDWIENYISELEEEKAELIELLKDVNHVLNDGRDVTSNNFYHNKINELLKKYSPS